MSVLPQAPVNQSTTSPVPTVAESAICWPGQEGFGVQVTLVGVAGGAKPSVMLALLMSKKMFPTASTRMRPCVVETLGSVTCCEPSFGVFATRVVGKVAPASVEKRMLTLAQLTLLAVVP